MNRKISKGVINTGSGEPVMNKTGKIPCPDGASVLGQELAVDSSDTCLLVFFFFLHNLKAKDALFNN